MSGATATGRRNPATTRKRGRAATRTREREPSRGRQQAAKARRADAAQPASRASETAKRGRDAQREPEVPLTVRPALLSDHAPLQFFFDTVLRRDYFLRRGQLEEMLRSDRHSVFVAEFDLVLVGVAVLTRGARLVNALVHPAYRGLGVGRALVEESGAREVRAKLDMSTGDPRSFYASLGFSPTGERNGKGNIELMRRRSDTPPDSPPDDDSAVATGRNRRPVAHPRSHSQRNRTDSRTTATDQRRRTA